jgi:hypothetical protein
MCVKGKVAWITGGASGRTIRFITEMPAHVCINELVFTPVRNRICLGGEVLKRKT